MVGACGSSPWSGHPAREQIEAVVCPLRAIPILPTLTGTPALLGRKPGPAGDWLLGFDALFLLCRPSSFQEWFLLALIFVRLMESSWRGVNACTTVNAIESGSP